MHRHLLHFVAVASSPKSATHVMSIAARCLQVQTGLINCIGSGSWVAPSLVDRQQFRVFGLLLLLLMFLVFFFFVSKLRAHSFDTRHLCQLLKFYMLDISIVISRRHGHQTADCLALVLVVFWIWVLVTSLDCWRWRICSRGIYSLKIGCIKLVAFCVVRFVTYLFSTDQRNSDTMGLRNCQNID